MNLVGVGRREVWGIRVALGLYFGLAALSDLRASVALVPGVAPLESSRTLQLLTGSVVLSLVVVLLLPRLSRYGAIGLTSAWILRTTWDMTGGQTATFVWKLLLPALAIVMAWPPERPRESGDHKSGVS